MTRGHPDWGQHAPNPYFGTVTDLGELAVRLGSPVVFDRLGNVIYTDSFEYGLGGWLLQPACTNYTTSLVMTPSMHGGLALRIDVNTDHDCVPGILRRERVYQIARLGFEVAFSISGTFKYVRFGIQWNTGEKRYRWRIRIERTSGKVEVYTQDGWKEGGVIEYINFGDLYLFHVMKMVVDMATRRYGRFLVDDHHFKFGDYMNETVDDATTPRLEFSVHVVLQSGDACAIVLDRAIITVNEP